MAPWRMVDMAPSAPLCPACYTMHATSWWRLRDKCRGMFGFLPYIGVAEAVYPSLVVAPQGVRS
jgi:hypothetical protein